MKSTLSAVKFFILIACLTFAGFHAQASDFAIEGGIRQQSGDVDGAATTKSEIGYQFGGAAAFEISGPWHVRTGFLYTQRPLTVEGTPDTKVSMNYLDIPAAIMYRFEDYAAVFGGVSLAINLDSSCGGGCKVNDIKSPLVPLLIGATFKFAPQLGGTIYFETASGEAAKSFKNYRAVGVNLAVFFE